MVLRRARGRVWSLLVWPVARMSNLLSQPSRGNSSVRNIGEKTVELVERLLSVLTPISPLGQMSKRIRIYTTEDVETHNLPSSCWISRDGKVYDVTRFLDDHPGGDDLILKYAGRDVGEIMKDPDEHAHSESAYDMMGEFLIGRLGQGENIVSDGG